MNTMHPERGRLQLYPASTHNSEAWLWPYLQADINLWGGPRTAEVFLLKYGHSTAVVWGRFGRSEVRLRADINCVVHFETGDLLKCSLC